MPPRDELLARFLRYVQLDTQSDPGASGVPSTPGQWDLLRLLAGELGELSLTDVELDRHGILTATLEPRPGYEGAETVGLLAHVDTSPAVSGRGVRPLVHRAYAGGALELPGGAVCEPGEAVRGHDIVTSDGSTLLGADDKAGVAEVMEVLRRLRLDPGAVHGRVRVAFTPDEEIGRGADFLDPAAFGAAAAYTLDGSAAGEIEAENFNAQNLRVRLEGRSAHTGTARGQMLNALHLAALLLTQLPAGERPETTAGDEGFYHADELRGNVEWAELTLLLRDFSREGLAARRAALDQWLAGLRAAYPGCRTSVEVVGGYENMGPYLQAHPQVVARAVAAVRAAGLEPRLHAIRGGTDGCRLTSRGLPTPNLFTGAAGFHSRAEWASLDWMEQAVETVLHLVRLWAEGVECQTLG